MHKETDKDDESGGSKSTDVDFRWEGAFASEQRDDLLSPHDRKHLLQIHKENHKHLVDKQKSKRRERQAYKEQRPSVQSGQQSRFGHGGGKRSPYKKHPLSSKAQFSGIIDEQVIGVPELNTNDANEDLQNELAERLENRNELRHTPKFNPKPRPY